jgi:hypothetical protein
MNAQTKYYLDCFIQSFRLPHGKRIRLKPIAGQSVPDDLLVECSREDRLKYPVGTIFKADLQLIKIPGKKPYLITRHRKLERAIEYFEYNNGLLSNNNKLKHAQNTE